MSTVSDMAIVLSEETYAGDLMDRAMDKLRTAHLALAPDNKGWHDDRAITAIWATLEDVIRDLQPVRDALQMGSTRPEDDRIRMTGGQRNG